MKTKLTPAEVLHGTAGLERSFRRRGPYGMFKLAVGDCERPSSYSETIQDDSYTVREIMEKFTIHGETWEQRREGLYQEFVDHDSMDLRQLMNLDLVDRDELISEAKLRQYVAEEKLRDAKKRVDEENARKVEEAIKRENAGDKDEDEGRGQRSQKFDPKKATQPERKKSSGNED